MENHLDNLAVKLNELGFDEECFGAYHNEHNLDLRTDEYDYRYAVKDPLWQQAFDWFRVKHNFTSYILPHPIWKKKGQFWEFVIEKEKTYSGYTTYEEARLACLEKLIELCKKH